MPEKQELALPKYCENIYKTVRRPTRTISIGKVLVGSQHPIALQTMTTTDTRDVMGTVTQASATFIPDLPHGGGGGGGGGGAGHVVFLQRLPPASLPPLPLAMPSDLIWRGSCIHSLACLQMRNTLSRYPCVGEAR